MKDLRTYIKKQINEGFKLGKNKVKKVEEDFVDLDLPSGTLWCKHNVGATCKSDAESWYGDYFTWGDPEPVTNKKCYWKTYKWCNNNGKSLIKYCPKNKIAYWAGKGNPDNKLVLDEEDDMANANMGGNWKMPTKEELQELIDNTTNEWVEDYNGISGLNGILFESKSNDNTLFIPAAGARYHNFTDNIGSYVYVWSSTLMVDNPSGASCIPAYIYGMRKSSNYSRFWGVSVRGVLN